VVTSTTQVILDLLVQIIRTSFVVEHLLLHVGQGVVNAAEAALIMSGNVSLREFAGQKFDALVVGEGAYIFLLQLTEESIARNKAQRWIVRTSRTEKA